MSTRFKRSSAYNRRRGVAAVEFAVVLPPILLLVLVSIEVAGAFAVQHALQEASMNGCRIYCQRTTTQQESENMVALSLAEDDITGYTVEFDPPVKTVFNNDLTPITVTVSVPYSQVGVGIQWMLGSTTITASSTLPADSSAKSVE